MTQSSMKRILNELQTLESESVTTIPTNYCYVLKIKVTKPQDMGFICEKLLLSQPRPSSVYYSKNVVLLIFPASSLTDDPSDTTLHQLCGNHHLIVSKYVRLLSSYFETDCEVTVEIVHFSSKTKVFSYVSYIIFLELRSTLEKLANNKITSKEFTFRTEQEINNMLLERCNIDIENVDPVEKYGVLMNAKSVKGRTIYSRLSEPFDARNTKKYISFMFG